MKSREYWIRREYAQLKKNITDEEEYNRQLRKIYQNMLDGCQKEIDSFYAKYAAAEGITIATAKRRVSKADIAAYERKAAKYVKEKNFSKKANEEMRLYNTMMKINRLEMLKANIGTELIAGHDELEKFMAEILKGRTEEELARQAGILGKTINNNAAKANAIVNGSFQVAKVGNQSTFSDRIWQYQDLMREDLGRLLQSGLIQGKNPRALAKDLEKYWYGADPKTGGGALYCMERLMRTELARVQTEAQKQSFVANGFDMYEFIVNSGCCGICSGLDGKHFKVKDMMPGSNAPPMHPNCRCSTAAWEDNDEYNAWLDYLSKGGTTEEWNNTGRAEWEKSKDAVAKKEKADKIKVDEKYYPKELAGITRGEPMSFEDANSGNTNPNIGVERGYSTNCQTCVVAFEARQRGYDVTAKPNTKGSMLEKLSYNTNLAWIDPKTGKHPVYRRNFDLKSAKKYLPYVDSIVEQGKRYTIEFAWKGRGYGGHIVNLDRNEAGQLRIKDNQRSTMEKSEWVGKDEVLQYLSRMKYSDRTVPEILRIDNMYFDKSVVDQILEEYDPT